LLLVAGVFFVCGASTGAAWAQSSEAACDNAAGISVLPSPLAPWKGAPLRVIIASEKPLTGELSLVAPDGSVAAASRARQDGPPYFWYAEVNTPAAGTWHARLATSQCGAITRDITVRADRPPPPGAVAGSVWPVRNAWNRATENLFSAWIEKLFDDPLDATPSWPALHEVLRDRKRNILFDYLGLGEDEMKMVLRPDCADLPYFLRAYFAFKMGLPFGFSNCSRGGGGKGPQCFQWFSIQNARAERPSTTGQDADTTPSEATPKRLGLAAGFGQFMRTVADTVHSGTARTALNSDNTDSYPVALSQDTLRPGVVYADPYGHVLMIVRRVPEKDGAAGIILFAQDSALGGPGFKRFRPVVREPNGALRRLTNSEIAKNPQYADFSLDQSKLGVEAFYDRMDDVMSPEPLDPMAAMKDAIDSLEEQVKVRVTSVENGRKFLGSGRGEASMPDGATIFETMGAWEDFSTPSRDLRLLIAIDVVRGFPDRVARRPERYAMPQGKSVADVKAALQNELASEIATRKFTYPRTDGSTWTLALKDVVDRMPELEMAYNPNDCVELRWGAAANSDEAATCRRHAPAAQRAKMLKYRAWFHERRRPPRA
jgi:hypothetical protein